MSTLTVALLTFAIAFIAGAMLGKAVFTSQKPAADAIDRDKHHELLKAQRTRYRKRVAALYNLVRRHEATQEQIKQKLVHYRRLVKKTGDSTRAAETTIEKLQAELSSARETTDQIQKERSDLEARVVNLQAELDKQHARSAATTNEIGLLRIEREELTSQLSRLEHEHREESSDDSEDTAEKKIAESRAAMGALREKLESRDRQIHELNVKVRDFETQKEKLQARLETMQQRVKPLTQKLRQQRQLIRQLRQASAGTMVQTVTRDDLKEIRGIGPALERKLRSHGIEHFAQLAAMSEEELAEVSTQLSIAPNMGRRQGWIRQARELHQSLYGAGVD